MNEFMDVAIDLSDDNFDKNYGGPFGACIVKDGKIIPFKQSSIEGVAAITRRVRGEMIDGHFSSVYTIVIPKDVKSFVLYPNNINMLDLCIL